MKIKTKTRTILAILIAYSVLFIGFGLAFSLYDLVMK